MFVVDNNILYRTGYDGVVAAHDMETGVIIWEKYLDLYLHSAVCIDTERSQLYVGTEGGLQYKRGDIVCLDLKTGNTKWRFKTKHVAVCTPVLINGMVISGSNDKNLYSLNPESGEQNWVIKNIGEVKGRVAQLDDVIFATTQNGYIHAIDFDGNIIWKRTCGIQSHHQFLNVHKEYGLVYVGNSEGNVIAFDKYGKQVWVRTTRSSCWWNLTLKNNVLMVVTVNGDVNELDALTGEKINFSRLNLPCRSPCDFNDEYLALHCVTRGFYLYRRMK
jgi:hypothetical protein